MLLRTPALILLVLTACPRDPARDTPGDTDPADTWSVPDVSAELHQDMATMVLVSWTQDLAADSCWIRYRFEGETWLETPLSPCTADTHSRTILGLPADTPVELELVQEQAGTTHTGATSSITTGPLPVAAMQPELEAWEKSTTSSAPWILVAIEQHDGAYYDGPYWQLILDRSGRVVWYRQLADGLSSTFPRPDRGGTHLVSERIDRFDLAGDQPSVIQRGSLDLTQLEEVELPGLRFAWDEAPDGSIWYFDREDDGEAWLSRHTPSGGRERLFDCATRIADRCTDTWCCEANAVVVEPSRNSVLMSLWATDTVLEVDLDTHSVRHSWGQLGGSWTTDPSDAVFDLQHYPNLTPAGTLLVSSHTGGVSPQQVAREFELDDTSQVLRQIWSHSAQAELFAQYQGEAQRLGNGNTLLNYGTAGVLQELTAAGDTAWSLRWPEPWMLGHTSLVDDLYALTNGPNQTTHPATHRPWRAPARGPRRSD